MKFWEKQENILNILMFNAALLQSALDVVRTTSRREIKMFLV
jgi:hypothetical protein